MKKYLFKLLISFTMLFFCINVCNADPYVANPSTNSKVTRGLCQYYVSGSTATSWNIDKTACVKTFSDGRIDPNGFNSFSEVLYVKWKNIERNADIQIISATYGWLDKPTEFTEVGPFTLDMPKPMFSSGSTYNISSHVNTPVTIDLNPYLNTADNGIDKGLEITSHFEWTLPAGWRTADGQTGTFVSTSSISVIPPISTSPVIISVRAKANNQFSSVATLQITRNLTFTIQGPSTVDCNATQKYTVPQISGATYSWQNQSGWIGQSTTNYIDITAQNTPNCTLICTISAYGQSNQAQKTITANLINPATSISGPSSICGSYEVFSFTNPAPMNFIGWTCSSNLRITSGNMMSPSCTVERIGGGAGWLKVELVPKCGGDFVYEKIINYGTTASIAGPSDVPFEGSGTWTANASGCAPFNYVWWLREATSSPDEAIVIGEGNTLTLMSYPRYGIAEIQNQSLSSQTMLQPPSSTNYYMKLQVTDAFGNIFTTDERHILAAGDVDLINGNLKNATIPSAGGGKTYRLLLNISPNPTKDLAMIELCSTESQALNENVEWQVEIYDAMQTLKTKLQKIRGKRQAIQTTGWKDGVYVVRAKIGNELLVDKLVLKK